ncbi:hypothetical protein MM213_13585 [Belliella sp. R4-6]|uniref:Uncharacterized protein n=1 Tax=Belliella alkalica TaxID=1730871 RepID=A0ABS9VET5_9BACT|nr:hypothetical protein [Belliella alkalica]MCH7414525.1 hypothetical protein [Belliella alkalica]
MEITLYFSKKSPVVSWVGGGLEDYRIGKLEDWKIIGLGGWRLETQDSPERTYDPSLRL